MRMAFYLLVPSLLFANHLELFEVLNLFSVAENVEEIENDYIPKIWVQSESLLFIKNIM